MGRFCWSLGFLIVMIGFVLHLVAMTGPDDFYVVLVGVVVMMLGNRIIDDENESKASSAYLSRSEFAKGEEKK